MLYHQVEVKGNDKTLERLKSILMHVMGKVIETKMKPILQVPESSKYVSLYQEVRRQVLLPPPRENVFVTLTEQIAKAFIISNCLMCGRNPYVKTEALR